MILCFGDSITEGRPGVTYLRYMKKKAKNFGLGGDTLLGMTCRIKKVMQSREYEDARAIVIGIGSNDFLVPFLKEYSPSWSKAAENIIKRGSVPCPNQKQFSHGFIKLLDLLEGKKTVVFGTPCFETGVGGLDKKSAEYSSIIEKLCTGRNVPFIDFRKWQKDVIKSSNNSCEYFFSKNRRDIIMDAILTTYLPFADHISNKRGLAVSVDGAHLNTVSAIGLAQLIEKEL